jgi:hypothetical protein
MMLTYLTDNGLTNTKSLVVRQSIFFPTFFITLYVLVQLYAVSFAGLFTITATLNYCGQNDKTHLKYRSLIPFKNWTAIKISETAKRRSLLCVVVVKRTDLCRGTRRLTPPLVGIYLM